jgi:hypothetical protein
MATSIRADAKSFQHDNFTATGTASSRTLPSKTSSILVQNLDATNSILVSLDGGSTFVHVAAGMALSVDGYDFKSLHVKSSTGSISVECVYGYEG